jgi:hypothetical protein
MSETEAVSQGGAAADGKVKAKKNFLARVVGVFTSPGETFEDIARKPTVIAPLLLVLAVICISTYITFPHALSDNPAGIENPQFQALSEDQQAQQLNLFRIIGAVGAPVAVLVFTLLFALIYWGLGNLMGGEPTFKGMFSMLLFGGMISIVANSLIKLPLIMQKETVAGVTFGPAVMLSDAAYTDLNYRMLASLDLFNVWATIVVGIGIAKVANISTTAGMTISVIFFVLGSGLGIALASLAS